MANMNQTESKMRVLAILEVIKENPGVHVESLCATLLVQHGYSRKYVKGAVTALIEADLVFEDEGYLKISRTKMGGK